MAGKTSESKARKEGWKGTGCSSRVFLTCEDNDPRAQSWIIHTIGEGNGSLQLCLLLVIGVVARIDQLVVVDQDDLSVPNSLASTLATVSLPQRGESFVHTSGAAVMIESQRLERTEAGQVETKCGDLPPGDLLLTTAYTLSENVLEED